ncbi:MAG: universal stress protein [Pseudomonadota bacterium]
MIRHILLPTDGSSLSLEAVKAGVDMAKSYSAAVTIYHALEPFPLFLRDESPVLNPNLVKQLEQETREAGERLAEEAKRLAEESGVSVKVEVDRPLSPDEGIVEAAKRCGCDLIFMASHGRSGVARLLLGSVAQKVLARSPVPVMVYRGSRESN